MYKVTNKRRRRTSLAASGLVLNHQGDSGKLLDHEILDPQVVRLKEARVITVEKIVDTPSPNRQAIAVKKLKEQQGRAQVRTRAARRARGEQVPPWKKDKE